MSDSDLRGQGGQRRARAGRAGEGRHPPHPAGIAFFASPPQQGTIETIKMEYAPPAFTLPQVACDKRRDLRRS